jgi:hypothetical protein
VGKSVITRTVAVAEGVFAPGHLGELTRIVPFEMVDEVLAETGGTQQRLRKLPARVIVYLLLAAGLFEKSGYLAIWRKLTGGLEGLPVPSVTGTALWHARSRLGVKPLRRLFDLLRTSAASSATTGTRWRGMLLCAIDGTTMDVPDTAANLASYPKGSCRNGEPGYPQLRLLALVACGTRAVIDAVFGSCEHGETTYGKQLLRSLQAGCLLLADRGFASNAFLKAVADTKAHLLVRLTASRKPPVLARYPDGSYLSIIGGRRMRLIEAEVVITTTAGKQTGVYRLGTTLLDHYRYPAFELVRLYHERWEVESAYFEVKKTILGGRVLRAQSPAGITQELYALLTLYQSVRIAITHATDTVPDADPDRASFSVAVETAREQLVQAAGVLDDEVIDLIGTIGRHVLDNLLPARRCRVSPRAVKRPLSRYAYQSLNVDRHTYKATISIDVLAPPDPEQTALDLWTQTRCG